MKGTIDQVEAFFDGISSVWWRVVIVFATCWAAHLLGSAAANFEWIERQPYLEDDGLVWGGPRIGYRIYLLPADWMLTLLFGTIRAVGILVILALVGFGYVMIFTDLPRLPLILFASLIQSWWSWYFEIHYALSQLFDGQNAAPLPGILLMLAVTSLAIYLSRLHWRKRREENVR